MKKVFLCAALVVAFVLTGCSSDNGVSKLPDGLRTAVEMLDDTYESIFKHIDQIDYRGVKVENHDIVFTLGFDRDALGGQSLREAVRDFKDSAIGNMGAGSKNIRYLLEDGGYALVFRLVVGGEQESVRINSWEIPEY